MSTSTGKSKYTGRVENIDKVKRKINVTNNFIGASTGTYNPQSIEVKKINIDVSDMDSFSAIVVMYLKDTFALTRSEAKVLVAMLEMMNTDREIYSYDNVFMYLAKRVGICQKCASNEFYRMLRKGFLVKEDKNLYKLIPDLYIPFKESDRKLIIDITFKPNTDD